MANAVWRYRTSTWNIWKNFNPCTQLLKDARLLPCGSAHACVFSVTCPMLPGACASWHLATASPASRFSLLFFKLHLSETQIFYFILFLCKIITLTVWTVIQVVDNHQGLIAGKENSSLGLVGCRGGAGGHLSTERHGGARYLCLARKRASSYVCVQMSWSPQPARERQEARYRMSSSYLIPALLCPRGFWTDKAGGL